MKDERSLEQRNSKNLPGRRDVRPSCFSVLRTQTTEPGGFIAHPVNGYELCGREISKLSFSSIAIVFYTCRLFDNCESHSGLFSVLLIYPSCNVGCS
jgi:hypothetical protein